MQLTCTAWVEPLNTNDNGWAKHIDSVKNWSLLSLLDLLSTGRHFLGVKQRRQLPRSTAVSTATVCTDESAATG